MAHTRSAYGVGCSCGCKMSQGIMILSTALETLVNGARTCFGSSVARSAANRFASGARGFSVHGYGSTRRRRSRIVAVDGEIMRTAISMTVLLVTLLPGCAAEQIR